MADYRAVWTEMWRADEWFQNLPTDARLFWMYLFTNPSASVSGIYKLPILTMAFESGLSVDRITDLFIEFQNAKKAFYQDGVVWVRKMRDYQLPGKLSDKLVTHLNKEIAKIPDGYLKREYLIAYGYSIDTVSIPRATDTDTDTDTDTELSPLAEPLAAAGDAPESPVLVLKGEPLPKPLTKQQEVVGALAKICQMNTEVPSHGARLGKTASALLKGHYTTDDVVHFLVWWISDPWRAKNTPVPTLAQVEDKIAQSKYALAGTNGNGATAPPAPPKPEYKPTWMGKASPFDKLENPER